MRMRDQLCVVVLSSLLLTGLAGVATAGAPQEQVRQTFDTLFTILADEALKAPARVGERRSKIHQVLVQRFAFRDMARQSLGRRWHDLTPEQQGEFVALFSDLLEAHYINRVESFAGGPQDVRYVGERIDADGYAAVHVKITRGRDPEYDDVQYLMVQRNGDWKVYDVVFADVSMVNNYRLQFDKVIRMESYEDLMQRLKVTLQTMLPPAAVEPGTRR
jgi:phospholipid transport system substrate-binding protein